MRQLGKAKWMMVIAIGIIAALGYGFWTVNNTPLTITVDIYSDRPERVGVYWTFSEPIFHASQKIDKAIMAGRRGSYEFTVVSDGPVKFIRLDPMTRPGRLLIRQVTFQTRWQTHRFSAEELFNTEPTLNQARIEIDQTSGDLGFVSLGDDPFVVLPVPELVYAVGPGQLARVVTIAGAVGGGLSWLLVISGPIAFRSERMGRLSNAVIKKSSTVVMVAAGLTLISVIIAQTNTARVTPFLQGPDEYAHLANSMHSFANWFGESYKCGEVWPPINEVDLWVRNIRNNPNRVITAETILGLEQVFHQSKWSNLEDRGGARGWRSSCTTSNLMSQFAYNIISVPVFMLRPDSHAGHYMITLRYGQILTGAFLWLCVFWIIARGRYLLDGLVSADVNRLRLVMGLAAIAYLILPQQVFLTSVLSREAYLVPLGTLIFVSFVFRRAFLSGAGALLFVVLIFDRRPSYALPVITLSLWYLALYLRTVWEVRYSLFIPTVALVSVFLSLPLLLYLAQYFAPSLGVRLPGTIVGLDMPTLPWRQTIDSIWFAFSLNILQGSSFVGVLGSMDTPLPWSVFERVHIPFYALKALVIVTSAAIFICWVMRKCQGKPILLNRSGLPLCLGTASLFLIAIPLSLGMVAYTIYEVYASSFDSGGRPWGWGVQGRYFLPLYFPVYMSWFVLGFCFWLKSWQIQSVPAFTAKGLLKDNRVFMMVILSFFGLLSWTFIANQIAAQTTLVWRYFGDGQLLPAYLQLFR